MNWRLAFLKQAKAENTIRNRLNALQVEYSHQLHYLQMVTEKLAKGLLASPNDSDPPVPVHSAFVRLLQSLKGQPAIRLRLGYSDASIFRNFINSLLDLAYNVERLAPASAGMNSPNPEYPWKDKGSGEIKIPVEFEFKTFDPGNPKMIQLESLLTELLLLAE